MEYEVWPCLFMWYVIMWALHVGTIACPLSSYACGTNLALGYSGERIQLGCDWCTWLCKHVIAPIWTSILGQSTLWLSSYATCGTNTRSNMTVAVASPGHGLLWDKNSIEVWLVCLIMQSCHCPSSGHLFWVSPPSGCPAMCQKQVFWPD